MTDQQEKRVVADGDVSNWKSVLCLSATMFCTRAALLRKKSIPDDPDSIIY